MAEPSVATLFSGLLNPNQARQVTSARDLAMGEALANAPSGRASLLFAPQQVTAAGRLGRRIAGQDPRTEQEIQAEENRTLFQKLSQEAQQRFPNDRTGQLNYLADQLNAQGKVAEAQKARQLAQQSQLTSVEIGAQGALQQRRLEEAVTEQQTRQVDVLKGSLEAQKLQQEIEQGPRPDIGAVNPQDYTPNSLQAFLKSGNYSDLKLRTRPTAENLTSEERNFKTYTRLLDENKPDQARKFGVSAGIINENLTASLQKDYIATGQAARESSANALRYSELANQINQVKDQFGAGTAGGWEESYKNIVGSQDAVSDLKTRYRSVRASAAMDNLPPGAASDVDVALALSGVPDQNANAKTVIRFLNGLAKLEREVNRYNQAKLAYIDKNTKIVGFESEYRATVNEKPVGVVRTTENGTSYTIIDGQ